MITDSGSGVGAEAAASACERYRDLVEQALSNRRNGVAIYQELVDKHGFQGSYSSVRRFVRKLRGRGIAKTFAVIQTDPGEEAQVDYGTGPPVRHPASGKYRRPRLFVLTLGHSRKCVRILVWHSSTRIWAELHEKAFRRLGGCPRVMVLDNLKEGVLTPDIYDPSSIPCTTTCSPTTAWWHCRAGSETPTVRARSNVASTMHRKRP